MSAIQFKMYSALIKCFAWFTQQTDRGAPSNVIRVPLAEVEEDVPEEGETPLAETPPTPVITPPTPVITPPKVVPARIHRDSGRDQVKELEPIDEQSERQDSASPESN